ncbi:MAG TPA: acetate/propionate family kinase [Anaerolineae bacterium]|nr:acetate/propionate family kinase [Anaerolineae bacterium]
MEDPIERGELLRELRAFSLFQHTSPEMLEQIVDQAETAVFAPGEVIIPFGPPVTFLGVVLSGRAEARARVYTEAMEIRERGDYFGEVSLMTGEPAAFTIVATEPTRVLMIADDLFSRWVASDPQVRHIFARSMGRRMVLLEDNLKMAAELEEARRSETDPYGLALHTREPMKILVVNVRRTSFKFSFFDTADESKGVEGQIRGIGSTDCALEYRRTSTDLTAQWSSSEPVWVHLRERLGALDHAQSIRLVLDRLCDPEVGVIESVDRITAVGHRIVHGGHKYDSPVRITDQVIEDIEAVSHLAPLHNPMHLEGIQELSRLLPDIPHVAVFDTAFHQTIPEMAQIYGLPYELYEQDRVRRYGFHGPSHQYVALRSASFLGRPIEELKVVTCHLGEGGSLCAIDHGRSIDTSMGLTPLEGLIMPARSGDIDPAIVVYLQREKGMTYEEVEQYLNLESGLKGFTGISDDVLEIVDSANAGNRRAILALQAYCYRIRKYIGSYFVALGGLDALVFTAGVGEGSSGLRAMTMQGLWHLGIVIDEVKNRALDMTKTKLADISHPDSRVKVLVVHTEWARMIARETIRLLGYQGITEIIEAQRIPIPIGVSAHHVHLSEEDLARLFGPDHELTPRSPLNQPGQFAAEEQVSLIGPKGRTDRVRVLGPVRGKTQVEISRTEEFRLGIQAPVRMSGDLGGSPGLILEGPVGQARLEEGVICAQRHLHMTPEDALRFGLRDGDGLSVRTESEGEREVIFGDVVVRVNPRYKLELHLDTDEANAAQVTSGDVGYLVNIQRRGNR